MVTTVLFGLFAVLLLIGAPIAICLGMSSVSAMLVMGAGRSLNVVLGTVPQLVSAAITKSVLMAIPFFILGGNIMEKSGISTRLIKLAQACVGHFKGGVAMVCVLVACFFAAISGSGPATVAALGLILIPAMIEVGYPPAFAAALMATAGAIGVIIPPSITFVVYGSISDVSIGDLFISGVLPGLLMGAGLIVMTAFISPGSDECGCPVTLESTGIFGTLNSMPSRIGASLSRAGCMNFEWNAPAVWRVIARLMPSSLAVVAAAATCALSPERTTCAALLMLAGVQPVLAHSSSSCAGDAPTMAIMPLGVASQASCMKRPRASSTVSVASKSSAPAAQSAPHSPSERPPAAANAVGRRFCSMVYAA